MALIWVSSNRGEGGEMWDQDRASNVTDLGVIKQVDRSPATARP